MSTHRSLKVLAPGLVFAIAISLSGCGKDDSTSGAPIADVTTTTASAADATAAQITAANQALNDANESLTQADDASKTDEGDPSK